MILHYHLELLLGFNKTWLLFPYCSETHCQDGMCLINCYSLAGLPFDMIEGVIYKCLCIYYMHILCAIMFRNSCTQPWLKYCIVRYISCKWLLGCLCSLHIGGFVGHKLGLSCDAANSKVCLTCFLKESV